MKGKIIKPQKKQNNKWISTLIIFVLGIVLVTNSNRFITITLQLLGSFIAIYGLYHFIQYFNTKKKWQREDSILLMTGIISTTIGLLTVLLAGIIEIGLRYLLGFYLLINGINKIIFAFDLKYINKILYFTNLIEASIIILLGLYTIFFANAALIIVGILLIISSIIDLISLLQTKK